MCMKRNLIFFAFLVSSLLAQAGEYAFLIFVNQSGDTTKLKVENLTMSVNASALSVTNAEGTVNLDLADLDYMQFMTADGQTSALDNVLDADAPIDVYSVLGTNVGHFDNLMQAAAALSAGVYVISNGQQSQKIVLQ